MERSDITSVASFFAADEPLLPGAVVSLGQAVARHVRALRLGVGSDVQLVDGAGQRADAAIVRLSKESVAAQVHRVETVASAPAVHMLVPVADRERMLWLAEKCAELGATSWRPVLWRRSRSVVPRGEGTTFNRKVRARMASAMEQSHRAHLPILFSEALPERAIAALPEGRRLVLHPEAPPLLSLSAKPPLIFAVGPEGGFEPAELGQLEQGGFDRASLGVEVLRFETAALAALAIARAAGQLTEEPDDGR